MVSVMRSTRVKTTCRRSRSQFRTGSVRCSGVETRASRRSCSDEERPRVLLVIYCTVLVLETPLYVFFFFFFSLLHGLPRANEHHCGVIESATTNQTKYNGVSLTRTNVTSLTRETQVQKAVGEFYENNPRVLVEFKYSQRRRRVCAICRRRYHVRSARHVWPNH